MWLSSFSLRSTGGSPRTALSVIALVASIVLVAPGAAAYDSDNTHPRFKHYVGGAIQFPPAGLYQRYDLHLITGLLPALDAPDILGDLGVGVYSTYYVYGNEFGLSGTWETDPAFLRLGWDAATEFGRFKVVPNGRRQASIAELEDLTRRPSFRQLFRGVMYGNLKYGGLWLYSRTTAWYRFRPFVEYDPWNDVIYPYHEAGFEQALAFMFQWLTLPNLNQGEWSTPEKEPGAVWTYLEYTGGFIYPVGVRPNRVSTGVVIEHFPIHNYFWNLDLFYSFADPPLSGPGFIIIHGFTFETSIPGFDR